MKRGRIKKKSNVKIVMLAISIIMLNSLGVSYAYWNDNLNMNVSVSTGSIEPYFVWDGVEISDDSEEGMYLGVSETNGVKHKSKSSGEITANFVDYNTIEITGWCYPGFKKDISLKLGNNGSIPVAYEGIEAIEEDDRIIGEIQYGGSKRRLVGVEDEEEINIQIHTKKSARYGDHTFNYEVQFEQGIR